MFPILVRRQNLDRVISLAAVTVTAILASILAAVLLGVFDGPDYTLPIRKTTRVISYPSGETVKIVCVTEGSRRDKNGAIIPLPIDTGVPQAGDLYVNTCRGIAQ